MGKKRVTRKEKREAEENDNFFFELHKVTDHFFKDIIKLLGSVDDVRHQSYITYPAKALLYMVLLKNFCNIESMRSMTDKLNKSACINNVSMVLGDVKLDELPHYDTINNFLSGLAPTELENIRTYMIKELLAKRSLERYRLFGTHWCIIFDATGLVSYKERHCEHCLVRVHNKGEENEKTVYMHHVLEAKLMAGDMVFSMGTEFIENEEGYSKQDCELKAFYRLSERIKYDYPRLPICMSGDSLYACEPVFALCDKYKWKYLIRFREGRIPSIADEFEALKELKIREPKKFGTKEITEAFYWVKDIPYNERYINALEFQIGIEIEEEKDEEPVMQLQSFVYLTDLHITEKKAREIVCFGRGRWKIENQGFNLQKNHLFKINHANSHNPNAMKNHYLLVQIAHIIFQLFVYGFPLLKHIKKAFKEVCAEILLKLQTVFLCEGDMILLKEPRQVRLE